MKRLILGRLPGAFLALVAVMFAGTASAVYYDMTALPNSRGYQSEVFETVTTDDYLRARGTGFMRFSFTKGSAFEATVYGCDTNVYDAATCSSLTTLTATVADVSVTTGRAWVIVDVTTAETAGNVSYVTFYGHYTSARNPSGGSGSTGTQVASVAALESCLSASLTPHCVATGNLQDDTTGALPGSTYTALEIDVPTTGLYAPLIDMGGFDLIWNHDGATDPGVLVNILEINRPAGVVAGSSVTLINGSARVYDDGVEVVGTVPWQVQGWVINSPDSTGPPPFEFFVEDFDFRVPTTGISSIGGGVNPASCNNVTMLRSETDAPLCWDAKIQCGSGEAHFNTVDSYCMADWSLHSGPRIFKSDGTGGGTLNVIGADMHRGGFDVNGSTNVNLSGSLTDSPGEQGSTDGIFQYEPDFEGHLAFDLTGHGEQESGAIPYLVRGSGLTTPDVASVSGYIYFPDCSADHGLWRTPRNNSNSGWISGATGAFKSFSVTVAGETPATCGPRGLAVGLGDNSCGDSIACMINDQVDMLYFNSGSLTLATGTPP